VAIPLHALCMLVSDAGKPSPADSLFPVVRLPSKSGVQFTLYFPEPGTTIASLQQQFGSSHWALCDVGTLAMCQEPSCPESSNGIMVFCGGDATGNACSFSLGRADSTSDSAPPHSEVTALKRMCNGSFSCDVISTEGEVDGCMRKRPAFLLLCDFAFPAGRPSDCLACVAENTGV
jgi:hypothetical protein